MGTLYLPCAWPAKSSAPAVNNAKRIVQIGGFIVVVFLCLVIDWNALETDQSIAIDRVVTTVLDG
jgi:hypothetical protein